MTDLRHTMCSFYLLTLLLATPAFAASISIELTSEASRPAVNDLVHATVAAEAAGPTAAESSKQVNGLIADALKTAKAYPTVKIQNNNTSTYPSYSKNGKIDSWRMRTELSLESSDNAALAELLGKLQTTLGISSLAMQPSPETRKKAENEAILDAIAAFKARAKLLADALGKPYNIEQLSVSTNGQTMQPRFRAATKSMLSEASPMPMETGETQISATVSGKINLE